MSIKDNDGWPHKERRQYKRVKGAIIEYSVEGDANDFKIAFLKRYQL